MNINICKKCFPIIKNVTIGNLCGWADTDLSVIRIIGQDQELYKAGNKDKFVCCIPFVFNKTIRQLMEDRVKNIIYVKFTAEQIDELFGDLIADIEVCKSCPYYAEHLVCGLNKNSDLR